MNWNKTHYVASCLLLLAWCYFAFELVGKLLKDIPLDYVDKGFFLYLVARAAFDCVDNILAYQREE